MNEENNFVGYEYHNVTANRSMESVYTDGYENFGWIREDISNPIIINNSINMKFKRNRKIRNKSELTRLQRQFDSCVNEIVTLEKSKNTYASITAYTIGILGCAFLGAATFSYLNGIFLLMIIFAIPGFIGWILPYFCYCSIIAKQNIKISPLIEKKYDEIYEVCEKANNLKD